MAVSYRLDVRSAAGVLQAEITDMNWLTYTKRVNWAGMLQFEMAADHDANQYLVDKALLEVWRRDVGRGVAWHKDADFIVRSGIYTYPGEGPECYTVYCPGMLSLLDWRIVAWKAATANRSTFAAVAAETILKTLVDYNACANATVDNGRVREGAIAGLSIVATAGTGNVIDYNCAWKNLLAACQEVARIGGGDFDLENTAPATWRLRWHLGQLGTDRSATVTFALGYGNMANPQYAENRLEERTVAIVGGQGEEAARVVSIRTGANYNVTINNVETFVDGRLNATVAALEDAGDITLDQLEARPSFSFDIVETDACVYNRDFFIGDLVRVRYRTFEQTVKIAGVTIGLAKDGTETKSFIVETP